MDGSSGTGICSARRPRCPRDMLIVIHGPPAAGKSTLALALHALLGLQVLSRDALAEALSDAHAGGEPRHLHHRAHESMLAKLALAACTGTPLIVEATLNPDGAARLQAAVEGSAQRVLEVFLCAPPLTLVRRFEEREDGDRHWVHADPSKNGTQLAAHLEACRYRPLHFADALVELDTDAAAPDVLAAVLREVGRLGAARRVDYDHQPAYLTIAARGGAGWDDRCEHPDEDSYAGLDAFIEAYARGCRFASVLDLGCGGGQAGLRFAELADRIVGIDYAETAIALARRNAAFVPHARFEVGDIVTLDGMTEVFEVVLDNHALHCLVRDEDRAGMLSAVARVLAPSGLFFCETMSRQGRFGAECFGVAPPLFTSPNRTRRWVSADELDTQFEAAGLSIIERRSRAPAPEDPPVGDLLWIVARRA